MNFSLSLDVSKSAVTEKSSLASSSAKKVCKFVEKRAERTVTFVKLSTLCPNLLGWSKIKEQKSTKELEVLGVPTIISVWGSSHLALPSFTLGVWSRVHWCQILAVHDVYRAAEEKFCCPAALDVDAVRDTEQGPDAQSGLSGERSLVSRPLTTRQQASLRPPPTCGATPTCTPTCRRLYNLRPAPFSAQGLSTLACGQDLPGHPVQSAPVQPHPKSQ